MTAAGRSSGTISKVVFPAGETIECSADIDVSLDTGAIVVVDWNGGTVEQTDANARLNFYAGIGTIKAVDSIITSGGNTILTYNVGNTPGLAVDDVIKIWSYQAVFSYGRSVSRKCGELMRVVDVSGQTVTCDGEIELVEEYSSDIRAAKLKSADKCLWLYDSSVGATGVRIVNNSTTSATGYNRLRLEGLRRYQIQNLYVRNSHGTPSGSSFRRAMCAENNCFRGRTLDIDVQNATAFNERYGWLAEGCVSSLFGRSAASTKSSTAPDFGYCRHGFDDGQNSPSSRDDWKRHGYTKGMTLADLVATTCHDIAFAEHAGSMRRRIIDCSVIQGSANTNKYQIQSRGPYFYWKNFAADPDSGSQIQFYNEPSESIWKGDNSDNTFDGLIEGCTFYSLAATFPIAWSPSSSTKPVGPMTFRDSPWQVYRSIGIDGDRQQVFESTITEDAIILKGTEDTIFAVSDSGTTLQLNALRIDLSQSSLSNGSTVNICDAASGTTVQGDVVITSNPNAYVVVAGTGSGTRNITIS